MHQRTDSLTSVVQPPEAQRPLFACVHPPLGLGGRGEKFTQRPAWITERDDAFFLHTGLTILQWICWFPQLTLQVIHREWGEISSQRMLPQVIRILYVLSFCFFQGVFIRWGSNLLFSQCLCKLFSLSSTASHKLFFFLNHFNRRYWL